MTNLRDEATRLLSESLGAELDWCLTSEGFARKANSMCYSRQVADGTQCLEVCFHIRDVYVSGAAAHVLPQVSAVFPRLNQAVLDMMGEVPTLESASDITFSQDLANVAPRNVRTSATRWFVVDHASARECVVSMRDFIQQWCIPFLNKYTTIAALTEGYERRDERLWQDRRFWLFVVAAYTLLGQPAKALEVLETKFGKAGPRREYARAFEYVGNLLKVARAESVDRS